MVNEIQIALVGRLTADPELRFMQNGTPVVNFSIASNARKYDRQANEWKDEEPTFLRASAFRQLAENIAASLTKGMEVVVMGTYKQRSYEKDGEKRTSTELEVTGIGPSLNWATASVQRNERGQQGGGQQQPQQQGYGQPGSRAATSSPSSRLTPGQRPARSATTRPGDERPLPARPEGQPHRDRPRDGHLQREGG